MGEKTINLVRFSTEYDRLVITVKNKSFPAGELCRSLNKNKCNVCPAKENKSKQCGNWIEMFFSQHKKEPFTVVKVNRPHINIASKLMTFNEFNVAVSIHYSTYRKNLLI